MANNSSPTIILNDLVLDTEAEVLRDNSGLERPLRAQSFAVLKHLAVNADRMVSKNELIDVVWPGLAVTENSLVQCIHEIRRALGDENQSTLKTVARRGYRLVLKGSKGEAPEPTLIEESMVKSLRVTRITWTTAAVLVVAILCSYAWRQYQDQQPSGPQSIAVLPFSYVSDDQELRHLAEGFTDDIITDLTRFRDLEVIAPTSSGIYKNQPRDSTRIGQELNVNYLLEGQLRRQGKQLRVTVQLVDTSSGARVWAERWDRPLDDVFAIQTELAKELAGKLGGFTGTVLTADRNAALRKRPSSLTAYDLYLLGIEAKNRDTKTSVDEAIDLLKRSLEIDPRFARAWTMLGSAYARSEKWTENYEETNRLYLDAVTRAVELDPLDAEAHAGLGFALTLNALDPKRGKAEFEEALRLNPNSADVLTRYSYWAAGFGEAQKGAEMAKQAMKLNPSAPPWAIRFLRYAFMAADRNEEAFAVHNRLARDIYGDADYIEGAILLALFNKQSEARALVSEAHTKYPDITIESWAGTPDWSDAERAKTITQMRNAGFTPCAGKEIAVAVPLPECH